MMKQKSRTVFRYTDYNIHDHITLESTVYRIGGNVHIRSSRVPDMQIMVSQVNVHMMGS